MTTLQDPVSHTGDAMSAGAQLRAVLNQPPPAAPLRALGAANAIAARAAADAGCDALWVSSLEVSAAAGIPDANLLCPHDIAGVVMALLNVTDLPVIVDIDNGGGSEPAIRRYVRHLYAAGAAAICLEDSAYPKCNSFSTSRAQQLADIALVCAQLAAARDVVGDDVVLIGRTESLISGADTTTALSRAQRLVEAGADAILIHSKDPTGQETMAVAAAWSSSVPLVVVPTATPGLSWKELGEAGFRLCIFANQLSRASLTAMRKTAEDLMAGVPVDRGQLATLNALLQVGDEPHDTNYHS